MFTVLACTPGTQLAGATLAPVGASTSRGGRGAGTSTEGPSEADLTLRLFGTRCAEGSAPSGPREADGDRPLAEGTGRGPSGLPETRLASPSYGPEVTGAEARRARVLGVTATSSVPSSHGSPARLGAVRRALL